VQGKLIAGVNNKVQLLRWAQSEDGGRELSTECTHTGHVLALYVATRGDFILVGERTHPAAGSAHA
jgi:DNA damage-binding protein 1